MTFPDSQNIPLGSPGSVPRNVPRNVPRSRLLRTYSSRLLSDLRENSQNGESVQNKAMPKPFPNNNGKYGFQYKVQVPGTAPGANKMQKKVREIAFFSK